MGNTPNIRFRGFSDDWEQRKVEEIAPLQRGFDLPTADMKNGKYPVVMSNGIGGYHSEPKAKGPGVVTGRSGTIGKLHYIEYDYWPHNTTLWVTSFKGNDPKFVYYLYQRLDLSRFGSGSGVPTLNRNDVHDALVMIPSVKEQKDISGYLTNLDTLITLHQRKCDETKELKKLMLQKMFPKNGEKKPEIRFEGFTDDWEQRKLEDYLEVSREKNKDELYGKEEVLSVSGEYGIVNQIEFQGRSFAGASVANYGIVEVGDVVYTKSPLKSNPYGIIKTNKGKSGIVSTLYAVYKPKIITDSEFVQIYFELDSRINSYMHPLVNKGAKNDMKVSDENALKGSVIFPKLEEQRAISHYFNSLDHLITLHQRKCDEIKEIKKFMLQNMFPQKG